MRGRGRVAELGVSFRDVANGVKPGAPVGYRVALLDPAVQARHLGDRRDGTAVPNLWIRKRIPGSEDFKD